MLVCDVVRFPEYKDALFLARLARSRDLDLKRTACKLAGGAIHRHGNRPGGEEPCTICHNRRIMKH